MSVERSELNVERSAPKGAVFLSYAREDAAAAKRIAEALRGFGVEVWFDMSELRGGDTWDTNIRNQIKSCALFIPIVSQRTEERSEGYFRREWKLAVDRTHDMTGSRAFIVPVVIDDTRESGAAVPEEFMRYQWTRLADGAPTPQFVEQVKRLLEAPKKPALKTDHPKPPTLPPEFKATSSKAAMDDMSPRKSGYPFWTVGALVAAVIGIGAYLWLRPAPVGPVSDRPHSESPPPASVLPARPEPAERAPSNPPPADSKSIAVLPFANFSADKDNAFFADGMHDEVITALAKIHDLTVISRTSVMAYKNPEGRNLRKIAAELGVANVLEGSVQRAGNRVKVIVQLIDAHRDQHLWAETYTEDLTDVFTIQAKLTGAIAAALKATLSPEEKSLIARRPTNNQEAYDLYLRARALNETLNGNGQDTREGLDQVAALYDEAIAKDPAFTLAYVQLCVTHGYQYWFGFLDPTPARRARAKAALDAAVRLAPDQPETRLALGSYAYTCENDWARALAEFRAAAVGLPNDAQLAYYTGLALRRLGHLAEALGPFARSVELNPRDGIIPTQQLNTLHTLRRFGEEKDLALHYSRLFPQQTLIFYSMAIARLELEHDVPTFLREWEQIHPAAEDPHGLVKAYRLAVARGDLAAAGQTLADPRPMVIYGFSAVIVEPVALHQAQVAWLRGQMKEARAFADEALTYFSSRQWVSRQEPWVMSATALLHALSGRRDEAMRLARASVALQSTRDVFDATTQRYQLAQICLILDRRDEALVELGEVLKGPFNLGPEQIRLDPLWSRLKGDPRFEEILKSAKPL